MDVLARFKILIDDLKRVEGSRLEKERILSTYSNDEEVKSILHFIFNPYITTGISKKKFKKLDPNLDDNRVDDESYSILNLMDYIREHNTGRDSDLAIVEDFIEHRPTYFDEIYMIITKDIKLGFQPLTLNKVFNKGFIPSFDVMLAESYFTDPDKYVPEGTEFDISTKMDGVRCVAIFNPEDGVKFFSRQGQPFEGLNQLADAVNKWLTPGYVYDGELLLVDDGSMKSKDLYRATVRITNKDGIKENLVFHIFDRIKIEDFQNGISYEKSRDRKDAIYNELIKCPSPYLKEVSILYRGSDKEQINYWLDEITSHDGEGVMLNLCDAPYECKRSRNILKVKKMQTMDLLCVGMEEGSGVNEGRLGALKVEFPAPDGKIYIVDVGGGFSHELRTYCWAHKNEFINHIIEVQYFEVTQNDKGGYSLRFPVFVQVRNDKSEPSVY